MSEPITETLPGAKAYPEDLLKKLEEKRHEEGAGYTPRTHHKRQSGWAQYTNRLFLETSPYLLQHAHNPVDWHPWGDEAFAKAEQEAKPVLLSVGYSTCHWCHVMEEESFEDEEIASYINENFVPIKVDREERPDVDAAYMAAVQAMTGHGGWPMTVFLSPDRKPFYGGTYFPPRDGDRGMRFGFLTLLTEIQRAYHESSDRIARSSDQLVQAMKSLVGAESAGDAPGTPTIDRTIEYYESHFDERNGGINGPPKFPASLSIPLLLRDFHRRGKPSSRNMALTTLDRMDRGGIHDHVGGGFHRYAVDGKWLVPHFEKMLYDNALLAVSYLEAYQTTADERWARVTRDVLDYVRREMIAPEGGFYSATDADSPLPETPEESEEGRFFTWTPEELEQVLSREEAEAAKARYEVTPEGNFEGRTVLWTPRDETDVASDLGIPAETLRGRITSARKKLYDARAGRPAPILDDKIIASWNGLMISAFARAGYVLNDEAYTGVARKAADHLVSELWDESGQKLRRCLRGPRKSGEGFLEDYAFVTAAFLDLFETLQDPEWLERARTLDGILRERFEDDEQGGFFQTGSGRETLPVREKPGQDGAIPSGNSMAARNLVRLYGATLDKHYIERAEKVFRAFGGALKRAPAALSEMVVALNDFMQPARQAVVVVPRDAGEDAVRPFHEALRWAAEPGLTALVVPENRLEELSRHMPYLEGKTCQQGQVTAYYCQEGHCDMPTTDTAKFREQLGVERSSS